MYRPPVASLADARRVASRQTLTRATAGLTPPPRAGEWLLWRDGLLVDRVSRERALEMHERGEARMVERPDEVDPLPPAA